MKIFEIKNMRYQYTEDSVVLDNINLEVKKGEQIGILGSNGSGKSTLLKIMDGLLFPTSGKISAFGMELNEILLDDDKSEFTKYFREKVGLIFQHSDVQLFSSSVNDEIRFGPLQLGMAQEEINKRVEDLLKIFCIEGLRERMPHTLSGGEKKRVAIAATLANNPEVLLLDEPTTNLDPKSEKMLLNLLSELKKINKTLVIATHNLDIAKKLCSRVIILDENHRIVADGKTSKILNNKTLLKKVNLIS